MRIRHGCRFAAHIHELVACHHPILLYLATEQSSAGWPKHWTISMARLKVLRLVHLPPINLLVSEGPMTNIHLENGFTLRCFQRLSVPNVATLRCPW